MMNVRTVLANLLTFLHPVLDKSLVHTSDNRILSMAMMHTFLKTTRVGLDYGFAKKSQSGFLDLRLKLANV